MNSRRRRGFTLIEMMVAIAVVAIASIAVFLSNSNALRQQHTLEQLTVGNWILQDQIARYHLDIKIGQPFFSGPPPIRVLQAGNEYEVNYDDAEIDNEYIQMIEFTVFLVRDGNVQSSPLDRQYTFVEATE